MAIALAVVLGLAMTDWPFLSQPKLSTTGTVVDHRRVVDDGAEYFHAKVRFVAGGTEHVVEEIVGFGRPRPAVGANVAVVYLAAAPAQARVSRPWMRAALYAIVLAMFAVLLLAWLGVLS